MKKTYLMLSALALLIVSGFLACQKTESNHDYSKKQKIPDALMTLSYTDSTKLASYGKTLSLGLIDLIQDSRFRGTLNDSVPLNRYDDRISFTILKQVYDDASHDLVAALSNSATEYGAPTTVVSILDNLTDSFQLGNYYFRAVLNIPFSNEVNTTLDPIIGYSGTKPLSELQLIDYSNQDTTLISEDTKSIAQTNPCWIITFRYRHINDTEWQEYLPWRRCTCPIVKRPDGTYPSISQCSGRYDGYAIVCSRANILGACPGNPCSVSADIGDVLPIFN